MADTGPARIPWCCCDDRLICRACRISVTWLRYYGAMLRKAPPLEAIEIFVAAAQGDSFRSVARRLALSPSAVSRRIATRSEEHTSELQSLMRISYAVFCLKKKK